MLDVHDPELVRKYIETAEHYFRVLEQPEALFDKPFAPWADVPYTLGRLAALIRHLQVARNQVVLDFGAGMCWLTGVLARTGCIPIALDVSQTALELGKKALRGLPIPPHKPPVTFLLFDGMRIPLEDGAVDRVACFDALHHVANKSEVLAEMFRVLGPSGRACIVEPGPGHKHSPESIEESEKYGVLEDEVDPLEIARIARQIGFAGVRLVPLVEPGALVWSEDLAEQMVPAHQAVYPTKDVMIVLTKGKDIPDSRCPSQLRADMQILSLPQRLNAGDEFVAQLRVKNSGNTVWLALPGDPRSLHASHRWRVHPRYRDRPVSFDYRASFLYRRKGGSRPVDSKAVGKYREYLENNSLEGMVSIGAHLLDMEETLLIDRDYARAFLGRDVHPGDELQIEMRMKAPETPGLYRLVIDPVDEYLAWFADTGSMPAGEYLRVEGPALPPDSRAPGMLRYEMTAARDAQGGLTAKIRNTGDTIWLTGSMTHPGQVLLGLQSLHADGTLDNRDWRRFRLSRCLAPGQSAEVGIEKNAAPADKRFRLDLVAEGICWFADRGNHPVDV